MSPSDRDKRRDSVPDIIEIDESQRKSFPGKRPSGAVLKEIFDFLDDPRTGEKLIRYIGELSDDLKEVREIQGKQTVEINYIKEQIKRINEVALDTAKETDELKHSTTVTFKAVQNTVDSLTKLIDAQNEKLDQSKETLTELSTVLTGLVDSEKARKVKEDTLEKVNESRWTFIRWILPIVISLIILLVQWLATKIHF